MKLFRGCVTIQNMESRIEEKAYAKLNISLDVSRARPDGFHDMIMVMQTVSLCDDITVELKADGPVRAECDLPYIPRDDRNLAVKAAKLYLKEIGREAAGAQIRIRKRIPVGAGMAGGSSDAAAVLRAMNTAFGGEMSREALLSIAEKTGSDVPFCLLGGTALAEGRGEKLTALPPFPACTFVICKPEFSISTPELFHALDRIRMRVHPDTAGIIAAVENGDIRQICRRMYNVFEDVPDRRMKIAAEIRQKLITLGAEGSVMTGTGSAVFGIFTDPECAEAAGREIGKELSFSCTAEPVPALLS